jgi:Rha family phage regulatory protein
MNDLVKMNEGELITTSKIIADVFGKSHRKVARDINELDCSDDFRSANFGLSSYTSPQNKVLKCFDVTRDGMVFLCMGFTGKKAAKWKEAYISAFNEMEKGLLNFDKKISRLTIAGDDIKKAGSRWSELGREINKQKKAHKEDMLTLMSDVQLTLSF